MHARLQRDTAARHGGKPGCQRLGSGGNFFPEDNAYGFAQNAVAPGAVTQIQPNGQRISLAALLLKYRDYSY